MTIYYPFYWSETPWSKRSCCACCCSSFSVCFIVQEVVEKECHSCLLCGKEISSPSFPNFGVANSFLSSRMHASTESPKIPCNPWTQSTNEQKKNNCNPFDKDSSAAVSHTSAIGFKTTTGYIAKKLFESY